MGTDEIERLERALERTLLSGTCRFRAKVAGTPLDGEIDLEAGVARSQLGVSDLVPDAVAEQIHRAGTVYQPTDEGDRSWIAMPVGTGGSDPTGMLDLLRGAVTARPDADASGSLEVEIDLERASARADDPDALLAWAEATGLPDRLTVAVRLDEDGRVRHVRSTLPADGDVHVAATPIEVAYDTFGGTVEIVVPPQDRIV